jgi:ABC-type Fe3+ transport system permease subunit
MRNWTFCIGFYVDFPIVALLLLVLTFIMAMIATTKARYVEDNSLSTITQKNKAKVGKTIGCLGFMITFLCLVGIMLILLSLYGIF